MMKFIEDCRDRHLNEEIWIIGCGSSLDSFPDDFFNNFFDDKTTIVLNWEIIGFPDSTYWCCPRAEMAAMIRFTHGSIMERGIFLFPFVPSANWELTEKESLEILGDYKNKSTLMRWRRLDFNEKLFTKYLGETIRCIAQKQECLCLGLTILHCAIQAAAIMGAKKITLVGCEAEYTKCPSHAQKRGMSYFNVQTPNQKYSPEELQRRMKRGKREKNGTRALAAALSPLGVLIQEFYFGEGYRSV